MSLQDGSHPPVPRVPVEVLGSASRAVQLAGFDGAHRYCGQCGSRMAPSLSEQARLCTVCGRALCPGLPPAVIVLVRREEMAKDIQYASSHPWPIPTPLWSGSPGSTGGEVRADGVESAGRFHRDHLPLPPHPARSPGC